MNVMSLLRIVALLEGLSFIALLGIAMPLKYMYEMEGATAIPGLAHGVLFTAYILLVVYVQQTKEWSYKTAAICCLCGILPFGTFYADKKYFKQ